MHTQSTPSRRSKYANDEERKAAARERQRLYAARKRAEAREAKLRADSQTSQTSQTTDADESLPSVESSPKARRTPRPAAAADVVEAPTPRKRATRKKPEGDANAGDTDIKPAVNGHTIVTPAELPDVPAIAAPVVRNIPPASFSDSLVLTPSDFLPPAHAHSDFTLIPPLPSPSAQLDPSDADDYAFLFLPGNPGLISYYTTYLTSLSQHLSHTSLPSARFTVFGASLGGFNVATKSPTASFYPLEAQITRQIEILVHLLSAHPTLKVILAGHSLGAYLILESLHRMAADPAHRELKRRVVGGIGLFPALTHLARSPSGRTLGGLLGIPGLLPIFLFLANILAFIVPAAVLAFLVGLVNPHFDADARKATVAFIKSPRGIEQAIRLGWDELRTIREDAWSDAIWGSHTARSDTELVFYFGEKDHWVADAERDALISGRGRGGVRWQGDDSVEGWKPRMIVCEDGVQHSFCVVTRDSELLAEKTATWIEEIVADDRSGL
ncbi:hypothetical protein Dda_3368 [Drechslerella dactyloides]|uniref:Uncharacterized protein n=1 Tax=Drechslerella dactyloides TaxID=74499 RepID=A0AAD6J5Q3_DREDA|nr:hypothetical protein Dda_3368 [Drechslerella dactyloides]